MEVRVKWLFMFLSLLMMVQFMESNRRPPMRPPPWRNPNQHHGRGGMPIPIHGDFANRRIYNGPPPPGPPNKFPGPPLRNKLPPPPPGYFNKQRRPPPPIPPPYGGFNPQMRPPPGPINNGPPPQHSFNNMNKQQFPGYGTSPNFYQNQNQNGYGENLPPVYPTSPPTSPALPPPPTTHQQSQQPPQQHSQQQQQFQQPNNQQQFQQSQGVPPYQQQQQQDQQPQPSQQPIQNFQNPQPTQNFQNPQPTQNFQNPQPTQNFQNPQPTNSNQGQWSQPFPLPNTTQIVGTIQPSQQTSQSHPHMTVVKPDAPKPSSTSQPQQIYQFHIPSGNNQQPNSIIQIHLSSTTESPKEGSAGKEYFTGSTFKPPKYDSVNGYPNTEYLPYEKPKTTPSPALNFKDMNADKSGPYERPIVYKNPKEEEDSRGPYKSHYTKPGQLIDFTTTESPYIPPGNYPQRPNEQNKPDFESGQEAQPSQQQQRHDPAQPQTPPDSKSDYEHALTPPTKHDYGLIPPVPKHDYGLSPLAKHDYEHYKNYKEYTNKYSQLDPLYHPDGEPKGSSNEDDPERELTLPERYDNSFSTNYKHEEQDAYQESHYNNRNRKRPQGESKPQPEEILSALGLSTNPLDHVDIVKTANDKYKKEPLYSLPDRQIEDDEEEEQRGGDSDSKEMGYPGTSYNMPEKSASASRLHPMKRPPPPEMIHPRIKGYSPPAHAPHVPDHREDDIITADSSSEYFQPKITHREDTPHYGRFQQPSRPRHPQSSRYPAPPDYSAYDRQDYGRPTPPPPGYRGHGPTTQPAYGHPIYVTEPDPIIEIIVQDSNVTLPAPPRPKPTTPAPVTPEPVHVFYVRYSNNNNNTLVGAGSENQNLRLEAPIPALAVKGPDGQFRPPPDYQQQQQHFNNVFQQYHQQQAQASQPQPSYIPGNQGGTHYNGQGSHFTHPSANGGNSHFGNPSLGGIQESPQFPPTTTTMRAIIRLDKNEFESNQLKVAFEQTNPFSHLQHQHQHQPEAEASQQQYTHANPPQNQQHFQSTVQQSSSQFQNNQFLQNRHPPAQQHQQVVTQNSPATQHQQFLTQNSPVQQQQQQQQQQPVHQNSQFQYSQQQNHFQHQVQPQQPQQVPRFSQQVTQFQGHHGLEAKPFQQQTNEVQPQASNQHPQISQVQLPQSQGHSGQFRPGNHEPQQSFQHQPHEAQPQASNQNPQTTQFQLPQSQGHPGQFRPGTHEHITPSHQIAQFQHPVTNNHFQSQQPQDVHQPQASNQNHQITQFQLPQGHQGQSYQGNQVQGPSPVQATQFQQPGIQDNQGDSQVYSHLEPQVSPSEVDFNMDPIWTNWNQQEPEQPQLQQHTQPQHQQHQQQQQPQHQLQQVQHQNPHQVQQQDQSPAPSTNTNQQVQVAPPQAPPSQSQTNYSPTVNYGGGEPLGLSGLHTIGTENNMRFENPMGLRPPPGPVYPKLGSFQKRIGLDDLATLLGEESNQHQQQIQADIQEQQQQQQQPQQEEAPLISATYHDPDQNGAPKQEQRYQQHHQQQERPVQYSASQQEKMSQLPDDVPEELKKQLLESGILGNAEVQVINYDQNLFKDLTNLPSEAIESFQQSDDISKLLASASRSVRSILVVNEKRNGSLRPKRKEASNKLLLFIEDSKTLIYDVKKGSVVRVENKFIQNAIDHTHHKIN